MANEEQLSILKQGVRVWNKWRQENPSIDIDLEEVDIDSLNLGGPGFIGVVYRGDKHDKIEIPGVNFERANLRGARLYRTNLQHANLSNANLTEADLGEADLSEANLSNANLFKAYLHGVNLTGANLSNADIRQADLSHAVFYRADLRNADLSSAKLILAKLDFSNLEAANLSGADLWGASLFRAKVNNAKISGSSVYGINVWDLIGEFKEQKDLIITDQYGLPTRWEVKDALNGFSAKWELKDNSIFLKNDLPSIKVDNLEIAQFIYLILDNKKLRDVINTLTSKSVLILGRFAIPERKAILDALRDKLREYNLIPIVFDFDRPTDKDFTETIKTLAGLSYFVIADVTNPKSSPLELQATVPDYQIPFVPIIQEGESPFAMMVDLQKKYNWVLSTVSYDSPETLIKVLKPLIIDPAMEKRQELRLIKAREPEMISAKDFLKK